MNDETVPSQHAAIHLPLWSFQYQSGSRLAIKTRRQLETELIRRAALSESFRRELLNDPRGVVEQMLGARLPEKLRFEVLQEEEGTFSLVIPCNPYARFDESALPELLGLSLDEVARWVCEDRTGGGDPQMARLLVRAWRDETFSRKLREDPRAAVAEELSTEIPPEVHVRVLLERPDHLYLLLPSCEGLHREEGKSLTDADLTPFEITDIGTLTMGNCVPSGGGGGGTGCRCTTNRIFTCG